MSYSDRPEDQKAMWHQDETPMNDVSRRFLDAVKNMQRPATISGGIGSHMMYESESVKQQKLNTRLLEIEVQKAELELENLKKSSNPSPYYNGPIRYKDTYPSTPIWCGAGAAESGVANGDEYIPTPAINTPEGAVHTVSWYSDVPDGMRKVRQG